MITLLRSIFPSYLFISVIVFILLEAVDLTISKSLFFSCQGAPHVILGLCYNKDEIHDAVEAKVKHFVT